MFRLIASLLLAGSFLFHVQNAAQYYGINPNYFTRVASCESRLDPTVTSSNKLYHGGFQFSWRTWYWMSSQSGYQGWSPYDPEAAAYTAAWAFANGYASHWPRCRYA